MSRLLYENSVSYRGHLIIPFLYGTIDQETIYSYRLLSELGHKGSFHKLENPAAMYSSSIENIISIAKEHLREHSNIDAKTDYFKKRYTYRNNLIIVLEHGGKYFYDHYPPTGLNNIAAPKIFKTEYQCISWIRRGLDRNHRNSNSEIS